MPDEDALSAGGGVQHDKGFGYIEFLLGSMSLLFVVLLTVEGGVEVWTPFVAPPPWSGGGHSFALNPLYPVTAFSIGFLVDGVMRLRWKPLSAFIPTDTDSGVVNRHE